MLIEMLTVSMISSRKTRLETRCLHLTVRWLVVQDQVLQGDRSASVGGGVTAENGNTAVSGGFRWV